MKNIILFLFSILIITAPDNFIDWEEADADWTYFQNIPPRVNEEIEEDFPSWDLGVKFF